MQIMATLARTQFFGKKIYLLQFMTLLGLDLNILSNFWKFIKCSTFSNFQLFENIPGFSVTSFTWIAEDSCKTSVLLVKVQIHLKLQCI